jgi:acyl carrier protein
MTETGSAPTLEEVQQGLVESLKEMTSDFDTDFSGEITIDTHLGNDLNFESVDVVEMVVDIEERYGRRDIPFQKMMSGKEHYYDFSIREIADFLYSFLSGQLED